MSIGVQGYVEILSNEKYRQQDGAEQRVVKEEAHTIALS